MKQIEITTDHKQLKKGKGYWSNRNVKFNPGSSIVQLTTTHTTKKFISTHNELLEIIISTNLTEHLNIFKNKKSKAFSPFFINQHQQNPAEVTAKSWWGKFGHAPLTGVDTTKLHAIPNSLAPLFINWQSLAKIEMPLLLKNLSIISQLDINPRRFGHVGKNLKESERYEIISTNLPVEEQNLISWILPFVDTTNNAKSYYFAVKHAIQAASCLLVWARIKNIILLPPEMKNVKKWVSVLPIWTDIDLTTPVAKTALQSGLHKLIIASDTNGLDDIPKDIQLHFPLSKHANTLTRVLYRWLLKEEVVNDKELFPVDLLRVQRLKAIDKNQKWMPAWIQNNINDEWYFFFDIYWKNSKLPPKQKKNIIKCLLEWAWDKRRISSPWQITKTDIWDQADPTNDTTYYTFVESLPTTRQATYWNNAITLYKTVTNVVVRSRKSPFMTLNVKDPFVFTESPFAKKHIKNKKTHRLVVPMTVHDEMFNTLISPDKDGNPTFEWARQVYKGSSVDWVTLPAPDNPMKMITVWCPSRTIAMGILLTSPLRGAQVRWLCQGLMDQYVYDLKKEKMVKNTHHLKTHLYANGKTHEEQYGRPSGILQTEANWNTDQTDRELCIYVNTNKTQLYDPGKTHGYTMPWPDGKKFLKSNDAGMREKGKWLARIYVLINYQLKWLQKYHPNPVPIGFEDVFEDSDRVPDIESLKSLMPRFVPLFRNLNDLDLVSCTTNGKLAHATPPISKSMLVDMFDNLAVATEKRMRRKGMNITLTKKTKNNKKPQCLFDIHSLRVTMITRCAELGIPVHIIEEFLAGHQSLATTLHYLVHSPQFVKERILKAIQQEGPFSSYDDLVDKLESGKFAQDELLTQHDKFKQHNNGLPKDFAAFVPVEGGICPMGGKGSMCHDGGLHEKTNHKTGETKTKYGPVLGGCGNCRFFFTGPDFLINQVDALNALMILLMSKARERKQLSTILGDIEDKMDDLQETRSTQHKMIERNYASMKGQYDGFEKSIEPLIIEWYNRYELLLETKKIMKKGTSIPGTRALIGGVKVTTDDYSNDVAITTEFGLLCTQLDTARVTLLQGFPIPEQSSGRLLRFLDKILQQIYPDKLMLSIKDAQYAVHATACVAGVLRDVTGDDAIQKAIDANEKLTIDPTVLTNLKHLIDEVHAGAHEGILPSPDRIEEFYDNNSMISNNSRGQSAKKFNKAQPTTQRRLN
jgi:Putative integrase